ncbi:nitrile hydratase accessory protein [Mesorhizobium sp.]|uniref:nitrile hydratase accessory protein n=1 Tax=Mesorhizobium sp. TaxID=1871066 RepID=UPI00257D5531|nr:nitrile hydratase accessory protein [Mesorhizobium sp.]
MTGPRPSEHAAALAASILPLRSQGEPLFRVAWHARVFSLIVSLVKDGRIPWTLFQKRLVRHIAANQPESACLSSEEIDLHYFDCWLEAAHETLVAEGFITDKDLDEQVERIHETVETIRTEQLTRKNGRDPVAVDVQD